LFSLKKFAKQKNPIGPRERMNSVGMNRIVHIFFLIQTIIIQLKLIGFGSYITSNSIQSYS